MNYEIVSLKEKTTAGVSGRTNNQSPDMGTVIGGLWNKFFQEGIYDSIPNKKNRKSLGIYADYEKDEKGDYTVMAACEIEHLKDCPPGIVTKTIPAGKYAKFVVKGNIAQAIGEFWMNLWGMNLSIPLSVILKSIRIRKRGRKKYISISVWLNNAI